RVDNLVSGPTASVVSAASHSSGCSPTGTSGAGVPSGNVPGGGMSVPEFEGASPEGSLLDTVSVVSVLGTDPPASRPSSLPSSLLTVASPSVTVPAQALSDSARVSSRAPRSITLGDGGRAGDSGGTSDVSGRLAVT